VSSVLSEENRRLSRAAGVVSFFTFLSRVLGLVRDMVIAGLFGAGMAADAFFVAFRIPNLLRRLFAEGSMTIAFIPVFSEYLIRKGRKDAFQMARAVLTVLCLLLIFTVLLGIIFAPWIVRLVAFGFGGQGEKYQLTVWLTRITFPYVAAISLVAFFMGVLNSLKRFTAPAAAPIFLNIGMIAGALYFSRRVDPPIVGVALGVLLGGFLQVILQLPWALGEGFRPVPTWRPRHPAVARIGRLMLPALFGSAVYQVNQLVGTLLASFLKEGSISWLYYADRLVQFPLGVFAIAVSTAALPSLSDQAARGEDGAFFETLSHGLRLVLFIALPSMAGLIILREPIVSVLFERGQFDAMATRMTCQALLYYTLGLWAFSGIRVVVSAFYALQDTRTPVKVATWCLAANALFSVALMGPMGHGGLALSLSLASALQLFLLLRLLPADGSGRFLRPVWSSALRNSVCAIIMTAGLLPARQWLIHQAAGGVGVEALRLGILVGLGAALYIGAAWVSGSAELAEIVRGLRGGMKSGAERG